jgi:hypothetical protein
MKLAMLEVLPPSLEGAELPVLLGSLSRALMLRRNAERRISRVVEAGCA